MTNTFSFEGFCYRDSKSSYFFKSSKGKPFFLCQFSLFLYALTYRPQYVMFLDDMAIKAYETLEEGKAYLLNGRLFVMAKPFNIKNLENTKGVKENLFFRGLIPLATEIYKTKSRKRIDNRHLSLRQNIELKKSSNHIIRPIITEDIEFIAKAKGLPKFEKLKLKPKIKEHLKSIGIQEADDDWE